MTAGPPTRKLITALFLFAALSIASVFLLAGRARVLVLLIIGLLAVKAVLYQLRSGLG